MYAFFIVVHVFVCLVLIMVILLQAGRGGGFSDLGGGLQTQSLLGTQTNTFMTRATEICAIVFVITSLSLGIISTQRGRSLVDQARMREALKKSAAAATPAPTPAPKPESTPAAEASAK